MQNRLIPPRAARREKGGVGGTGSGSRTEPEGWSARTEPEEASTEQNPKGPVPNRTRKARFGLLPEQTPKYPSEGLRGFLRAVRRSKHSGVG